MGKKLIQRAGNDHIHIQKQGRAAQAVQSQPQKSSAWSSRAQEYPAANPAKGWATLHLRANALGVIGQANKVEITLQVPPHHGVQAIDVFRAVLGAPFMHKMWRCGCDWAEAQNEQTGWSWPSYAAFFSDLGEVFFARLIEPPAVRRWLPSTRILLDRGLGARAAKFRAASHRGDRLCGLRRRLWSFLAVGATAPAICQYAESAQHSALRKAAWYMVSRWARSSPKTRTLIRPWAFKAASISFCTPGVKPSRTNEHNRAQVVGIGAVFPALGGVNSI